MRLLDSPEAWLAIGVSLLFVVAGVAMHRAFVAVLKKDSQEPQQDD